ncbi:DUF2381 family protein [Archangium violaceum]|uniref:DUF2381 family protein n=1 Tax=Archangium violaceum TaxID=83451 RepID=UPI00193BFA2D|nr:DUF2381 family protein [Archangium violaceum]QRK12567.1 DUF2381 family protein [Archangium violaceum]
MLSFTPLAILALMVPRGVPVGAPPAVAACEAVQRIELAVAPVTAARELCVSPGLVTSLRFDAPTVVELQDEVRFEEVVRVRRLLTLMPPPDMVPGERLRLTVRFEGDTSSSGSSFVLVAHPGRATHQVEVYRDKRTRESFLREVVQERARNAQLREELARTQALLGQSGGLRSLIASKTIGYSGVRAQVLKSKVREPSDGGLSVVTGASYRAEQSMAVDVLLKNSGSEPWMAAGASLVDARGEEMKGVKFHQEDVIAPNEVRSVIVEVATAEAQAQGELTLRLWDAGGRAITIPEVPFP